MSFEPTSFLIAGIGICAFVLGMGAILSALIVASVFQVVAFMHIETSPVLAYYFFGVLLILRGSLDLLWQPNRAGIPSHNRALMYLGLTLFFAILGAIFLPQLFLGLPVYSPKLSIDEQYSSMTRLALDTQQFNQIAQLIINAAMVIVIWFNRIAPTIFIRAIFFSFGITVFFAAWQLLANQTGMYYPNEWLYTVQGWSLGNEQLIGAFSRINSTFLEPSVFATYLTGFFTFVLVLWVRRPSWGLTLAIALTVICMVATTSTTAYLGLVAVVGSVVLGIGLLQLINGGWLNTSLIAILAAAALIAWLALIAWVGSPEVRDLFDLVVLEKAQGDSFRARFESDWQSLVILWQTYGLGVGLGGNRPSSFLTLLLSNLGIVGTSLFFVFLLSLTHQALWSWQVSRPNAPINWAEAASWGLWGSVFAKIVAQPDLSFAPMWIWIFFLGALASVAPHANGLARAGKVCEPSRIG